MDSGCGSTAADGTGDCGGSTAVGCAGFGGGASAMGSIAGADSSTIDVDPASDFGYRVRATASPLSKSSALIHALLRKLSMRSSSHSLISSTSKAPSSL